MTSGAADDGFRDPDEWHAPAAYWFWHRPPSDEEVRAQVRELHRAGYRSFQVQARLSYPLDGFLDEHFLQALRLAAVEAQRRGLIVGFFDDYNWEAGHAGGRAGRGRDELRERHLFWVRVPLRSGSGTAEISGIRSATENLGAAAMRWHYEGECPQWGDWRAEHLLVRSDGAVRDAPSSATIEPRGDGCAIRVADAGPGDEALALVSARCITSRLVNPLDPAAVARFVEAAYEPVARALGSRLGAVVRYLFFDQPHAVYYDWAERAGDPRSALPFHASLDERMRERFGDRLAEAWLALIEETDDTDALRLRAQAWETFAAHAQETFLGPVSAWTREHGLLQSGHEVLGHVGSWEPGAAFGNWDLRANFGLDHFGVDRHRDLTAADAQDVTAQLSPRLADSVARAHGRSGAIVEQYFMTPPEGGAPWSGHWGLSLSELRETAVRHHFAGMRQLLFHGFLQTAGAPWDDDPLENPRFDFPPGINLEPWFAPFHPDFAAESARLSAFLDGIADEPEAAILWPLRTFWTHGQTGQHAQRMGEWARVLTEIGVPFRIIDERQLPTLREELPSVRAVILPSVRTLAGAGTVRALREAADHGVRVVVDGPSPDVFVESPREARELWAELAVLRVDGASPSRVRARRSGTARGSFARSAAEHGVLVRAGAAAGGRTRVALFHDGAAPVSLSVPAGAERWDPSDGSSGAAGMTTLEPGEIALIVLTEAQVDAMSIGTVSSRPIELRALATGWTLRLVSDVHGAAIDGAEHPIDVANGWQGEHPDFSGTAEYRARISGLPTDRDLVLRIPAAAGSLGVAVNGVPLGRRGWRPFRFDIPRTAIGTGDADIRITVAGSAANAFYAGTGLRTAPEPDGLLAVPVIEERRG